MFVKKEDITLRFTDSDVTGHWCLLSYTSDSKSWLPFKDDDILELDVYAHKSLRLFLYKKLQREYLLQAYNEPIHIYSDI